MASFAETLTPAEHKRGIRYAYVSTWFGCFADVMMDSTALVIIYFTLLKASNSLIMFSSAMTGLVSMVMLLPASFLVIRFGVKRMVGVSCCLACSGYLIMSLAPLFGSAAPKIVLAGIFIFCLSRPIWSASWYPILTDILLPQERAGFLGKMRFSYTAITGTVFYLIGQFMGKEPPLWYLQAAMALTGIFALGRYYCISKITLSDGKAEKQDIKKAFSISVHNAPLVGFSIYVCFFGVVYFAVMPLALLYMKNGLKFDADTVQMLSIAGIVGNITAFLLYGKLHKVFGMRNLQLGIHFMAIILPILFFFCSGNSVVTMAVMGVLLYISYMVYSLFTCCFSHECLSLSRPGNAAMASAFAGTYNAVGTACGRSVCSLLLGQGMLAASWKYGDMILSNFQTIFLFCSAGAIFGLTFIFILPSVISTHDDYYQP